MALRAPCWCLKTLLKVAMLVSQTCPVRVELSYLNAFFCGNK